jgi:hypothetical protein
VSGVIRPLRQFLGTRLAPLAVGLSALSLGLSVLAVGLSALALSLACTAAPAQARLTHVDGISDQNLAHWDNAELNLSSFSSANFPSLISTLWAGATPASHIQLARFVVPWDAIDEAGGPAGEAADQNGALDFELFSAWLADVSWLGLTPVVALEPAPRELAADGDRLPPLLPRSREEYERYVAALLSYAAQTGEPISYLEAWNEPNDRSVVHPSPSLAAEFTNAATSLCVAHGCTPIAGDFLDSEFRPAVEREGGLGIGYEMAYSAKLHPIPVNWGFHPYAAVKYEELMHGEETTITRFETRLPTQHVAVWFTEVGAYYCQAGGDYPQGGPAEREAHQRKNAEYLNLLINDYYEVAHVFYYELSNGYHVETNCATESDTSLFNDEDRPRQAASVVLGGDVPRP